MVFEVNVNNIFYSSMQHPYLTDSKMPITSYSLGYRLHVPDLTNNKDYFDVQLSGSATEYRLTGLDEYTLYDIILEANRGSLPSYRETRRTSAERKFTINNVTIQYTSS